MQALSAAGMTHPGMSELEREYANKKLTALKLDADTDDTILVPEEVAREMQRLAAEVCACAYRNKTTSGHAGHTHTYRYTHCVSLCFPLSLSLSFSHFINSVCLCSFEGPVIHVVSLFAWDSRVSGLSFPMHQVDQRRKEAEAAEAQHQQAQSMLSDAAAQALTARTAAEAELQAKLSAERALREQLEATALQMRAAEEEVKRVRAVEGAAASEQAAARAKVQ